MVTERVPDGGSEEWVERVLQAVEQIPPGRVMSYGDLAELAGRAMGGGGGPRQVGQVMARYGGAVAWWRVVRADGRPVRGLEEQAAQLLRAEGTPMHGSRVAMDQARFRP